MSAAADGLSYPQRSNNEPEGAYWAEVRDFRGDEEMSDYSNLFQGYEMRGLSLPHRVVMSPMTRSRAGEGDVQGEMNAEYYRQRASASFIVTEGVQPSLDGKGYCRTPGLHTDEQVAGWKLVTDAVHAEGGRIFCQLMHAGRIAHPLNKSGGRIVSASAVQAAGQMFTVQEGPQDHLVPEALTTEEVKATIADFRHAGECAKRAGFDGIELHAGQGYLPMQFLSPNVNQRDDEYGGSAANRARFSIEIMEQLSDVMGADRVGIRIAPGNTFNDVKDEDPVETYTALLQGLRSLNPVYLHVVTPFPHMSHKVPEDVTELCRSNFEGTLIRNGGYTPESADAAIASGEADLVAFGKMFLANPDLPKRFETGAELNEWNMDTFYTPGPGGYIDYPALDG